MRRMKQILVKKENKAEGHMNIELNFVCQMLITCPGLECLIALNYCFIVYNMTIKRCFNVCCLQQQINNIQPFIIPEYYCLMIFFLISKKGFNFNEKTKTKNFPNQFMLNIVKERAAFLHFFISIYHVGSFVHMGVLFLILIT